MDCARNIITANFGGGGTSATTAPLWQWDYGQVLCITGIDLPAAFEVHFSTNRTGGVSTVAVGADGQVTIPNDLLTIGKNLNAWIYLSDAQGEGETEYSITIPVKARPMPETYDAEVSGEFDDVVRQVSEYAQTAQTAADNAGASASAAATSASETAASASAAESAKTAAETAQGEAEDAQTAAETAAQTATEKAQQTAQDAAQAAQSKADAESAAGRAEAAQTGAESAKTDAETAAQDAANSASAAGASATSAGQAATSAAQSATAAAGSATTAQGAAQTATTKAGEASASATAANTAKTAAQTAQTGAEAAETNAGQSASTASTKAAEAAQSATDAAASKTAAEAAATRAEQAAATLTVDTALSDTSTNPVQNKVITGEVAQVKSHLSDNVEEITGKLLKIESNNYAKSDSAVTSGYIAKDGTIYASDSYFYTDPIPVKEGDVIRLYTYAYGAFTIKSLRFVCAYNSSGQAVSASGADNVLTYTVPTGIDSVVLTSSGSASNVNQLMITKNYEATEYEAYFQPYYIASEEFIEDVLNEYEPPMSTVAGYNILKSAENGVGAYYASGSTLIFNASYTSYHYAIMPVEPNSRYYVSCSPRWLVLTDDDNNVLSSGAGFNPQTKRYIDTGNATKFYYTIDNGKWNNETTYGAKFAIIVSKSNTGSGSRDNVRKPEWLNGLSQRMCDSKYAFAFNRTSLKFTKNANKKFYFKNLLALDSNYMQLGVNSTFVENVTKDYISITYTATGEKAMFGYVYDVNLSLVEQQSDIKVDVADDNLSNCSALVIGDSTVEQNIMTQKMLDAFIAKDKTITLLGTRGTAPNLHEGRSGWSAKQYCTQSTDNPFYNNGFDFSHYMTAQGYSAVDFVVLQIGINDLYNVNLDDSDDKIAETMGYVCSMIDSILAWNASQKIIVNLPTPVNPNHMSDYMYVKRNIFVRYNAKMLLEITKYNLANVRPSDTFAILDPESDISDNVHPTTVGYEKMANEVVNQINCWQNSV